MITSYTQITPAQNKAMLDGPYKVKHVNGFTYSCNGIKLEIEFGESPEAAFINLLGSEIS